MLRSHGPHASLLPHGLHCLDCETSVEKSMVDEALAIVGERRLAVLEAKRSKAKKGAGA